MGAALDIHNDSGGEVEVEIVHPANHKKRMAADEIWNVKRRKTDTEFFIIIHKLKDEDKNKEKPPSLHADDNWRALITEYKQKIAITPQMGNRAKVSVASIIRHSERKHRSTAIRQEIMNIKDPLTPLCTSIGTRWLACSRALQKRRDCHQEGITYRDYVNEDRTHIKAVVDQIDLDLKRTAPRSFRIRNKRSREPEDRSDIEKREWFERMEAKLGGREQCIKECRDILVAFVQRNVELGYSQGLNYVVYFLLGFLHQEHVFWLLCTMVEDIRLPDFYAPVPSPLNGFQIEAKTLLEVAEMTERQALQSSAESPRKKRAGTVASLVGKGSGLFGILTGRGKQSDTKDHLLHQEDENCERIGGDLGVLYQKTTEWMIPLFITVVPLHPAIMIMDNFFDLYPDLEDAYPSELPPVSPGSSPDKNADEKSSPSIPYPPGGVPPDGGGMGKPPVAEREASADAWNIVNELDVAPRMGSGEAMVYCTFLTAMDLVKQRLEDENDLEARESFSKLFDTVALGITCGDLKHGLQNYAHLVGESQLLHLRAKYRNRLAERWNKSTERFLALWLPMLCDDLRKCYKVVESVDKLKSLHEDFQFLMKKTEPGMSRTEFCRLLCHFPTLFPRGVGEMRKMSKSFGGKPVPAKPQANSLAKISLSRNSSLDLSQGSYRVVNRVNVLQGIFDYTDKDKGGFINFKELMCTLAILCANDPNRHYRLIYDVFDDTRSGYLNTRNLMEIARWLTERHCSGTWGEGKNTEKRKTLRREYFRNLVSLLRGLDKSGNHKLSFTEFSEGVSKNKELKDRIHDFRISMEEVEKTLEFRVKVKKEKSQLDIEINTLEGFPVGTSVKCCVSVTQIPEKLKRLTSNASQGSDQGSQPVVDIARGSSSVVMGSGGGGAAVGTKLRRWGPWETKYRTTGEDGKADIDYRTHMTMAYGKPLSSLQVRVEVKKRAGRFYPQEEVCGQGTFDLSSISPADWEKQEAQTVRFEVEGDKLKAPAFVGAKFIYKKEWDEEVKRNKQALANIQALFGTQMI